MAIKRVIDPYVRIRMNAEGSAVETQHVKMSMNPFDEIALEEAIRCKERGQAQEVVVVSIGTTQSQETLRTALALGADRAILVETTQEFPPLSIAKILKFYVQKESPEVVILGKQSIDGDNNQTGQMLAGLLGWPQGAFISELNFLSDKQIKVSREVDEGLEVLTLKLPAVLTADLRLNEPRYPSLPNIMKAKSKPLTVVKLEELGLTLKEHKKIIKIGLPPQRKSNCEMLSVQELVNKLTRDFHIEPNSTSGEKQ